MRHRVSSCHQEIVSDEEFIPADAEPEDWAEAEWCLHYREDLTLTCSDEMPSAFRWRYTELRDQSVDAAEAREQEVSPGGWCGLVAGVVLAGLVGEHRDVLGG